MSDRPIGDHAFLSDSHSSALVTRDGSIDWLTFPRFDSPSVMARILDDDAGHFRVGPAHDPTSVSRRYVDGSLVLETTFETPDGRLRLTDALAVGIGERGHDLGRWSPHVLLRHVECLDGTVDVDVSFAPRPEYGRARPLLSPVGRGIVSTRGGPDRLTLSCDLDLPVGHGQVTGTRRLSKGATASFALQWSQAWADEPDPIDPSDVPERLEDTRTAWTSWAEQHRGYDGRWQDLVSLSGTVLQGMTFQPTGAVVAAPTTSLPEHVGGSRNWDYRYAWLRDASMTLDALWVAACPDEAHHFVSWLVGAAADLRHGAPIQIMYGIGGEHDLAERTLDHLDGWRGSRPVRVGNAAFDQRQLDVYGGVLDAVARLRDQLTPFDPSTVEFLVGLADAAAAQWGEPDQGIWEVRGGARDFLYSKLMCWVALDRALDLADDLDADEDTRSRWTDQRGAIRTAILERGWDDDLGAFTQSFDDPTLDASALRVPLVGLLPGDDPRVRATIRAIEDHLTDDRGFVYRYRADDGLEGEEGSFLLCTFWLAHAHALAGDLDHGPLRAEIPAPRTSRATTNCSTPVSLRAGAHSCVVGVEVQPCRATDPAVVHGDGGGRRPCS